MNREQYYTCLKTLNLDNSASIEDIKRAYRLLVKRYHPDIAGKSEFCVNKFREITKAYKILLNERIDVSCETNSRNFASIVNNLFLKNLNLNNCLSIFKRSRKFEDVKFDKLFLKEVDSSVLSLGEDELIFRLEGSANLYVMVEAVKGLYKIASLDALIAIVSNYYKYSKDLKLFVSFLTKKKIDIISQWLNEMIFYDNYNILISVLSYLYNINEDIKERKLIKNFISDNIGLLKFEASKFSIIYKGVFSSNELKFGEKLLFSKKIDDQQLGVALGVKKKFSNVKIGKIFVDLGFLTYKELEEILKDR